MLSHVLTSTFLTSFATSLPLEASWGTRRITTLLNSSKCTGTAALKVTIAVSTLTHTTICNENTSEPIEQRIVIE